MTIAFIGLGMMGRPMAECLIAGGFEIGVTDANAALAAEFGDNWRETAQAAVANADVVITMLPNGRIVKDVVAAFADSLTPGTIVVDCSSSDAGGTVELGSMLAKRGVVLVDAPVSGGVPLAREGKLTLMVGGASDETYATIRPALECLGSRIVQVGVLGAGHAAKAINMAVAACTLAATCEGLAMGARFGIDPAVLLDVINSSTGRSAVGETVIKNHVLTETYAQGFALALMAKDVATAELMRSQLGLNLPMLEKTHGQWQAALATLGTGADFSEFNKFVLEQLGADV
jgi:3-hydroxyisobutyrate dehydrogenase